MNDPTRHDPALQSFEALLGATTLQLPVDVQREMLYRCAFASGKSSAKRRLRCWQLATAVLLLCAGGLSVLHSQTPLPLTAQHGPAVSQPHSVPNTAASSLPEPTAGHSPALAALELGAWQLPHATSPSVSEELAQLDKSDARLRALTVGGMTTALLNP